MFIDSCICRKRKNGISLLVGVLFFFAAKPPLTKAQLFLTFGKFEYFVNPYVDVKSIDEATERCEELRAEILEISAKKTDQFLKTILQSKKILSELFF